MNTLEDFFNTLLEPQQVLRTQQLFSWMSQEFPELVCVLKWKQPMFTTHGTFIISYSVTKKHLSVAPERQTIQHFKQEIAAAGYETTLNLIKLPWQQPVPYGLLKKSSFIIKKKKQIILNFGVNSGLS